MSGPDVPAPAPPRDGRLDPLDPPPERFGSAMLRRFGPLYTLVGFGRALSRIRLEDHSTEQIREAGEKGPVVYVLPRTSALDHLALNAALAARRLPLSVWAPGLRTTWWAPIAEAWAGLRDWLQDPFKGGPDPVASGWVATALRNGFPVTLFLEARGGWFARGQDPFEVTTSIADLAPSVQIVPVMVVWDRSPEIANPVQRFFLGKKGVPGAARRFWRALRNADAFIHVGRPFALGDLRERVGAERLPGVLRRVVARTLRHEQKLVHGPRLLPHRVLKKLVLDNPPMRQLVREESMALGLPADTVRGQLEQEYDRLAANFSWTTIQFLHLILRPLWTRVFSGVDVRPEDLDRIRTAMRDGTPVLVPCHKSHFDYVLLSWVLYDHDLIVPHVVAGMNLAFWPISIVLRGAGGFFVKRSFGKERLFPAVFARYLRELVHQEYPIEFFIEGGRTRSGRLLRPKVGVLSMVLDAAEVRSHGRDVTVLPIALAYERVAEEAAYAREATGEKKRKETLLDVVRARSVFARRFGRVFLRVGDPIAVGAIVDADGERPVWSAREPAERKREAQALGERIVARIGAAMIVLPTSVVAAALLALPRRALRHTELFERIVALDALLKKIGAPRASTLDALEHSVTLALDRFVRDGRVQPMMHEGERLWSIVPEERVSLDFAKNQILHFLAPAGLAACALRALPDHTTEVQGLLPGFEALRQLWRREFVWDPDDSGEAAMRRGLDHLVAHGAITLHGDEVRVAEVSRVGEIYGLFRPLLEGYNAVLQAEGLLETREAFVAALLARQSQLFATHVVTRPESIATVTLDNAIASLAEDGALRLTGDRLAIDPVKSASVRALLEQMVAP